MYFSVHIHSSMFVVWSWSILLYVLKGEREETIYSMHCIFEDLIKIFLVFLSK